VSWNAAMFLLARHGIGTPVFGHSGRRQRQGEA
jgi:hypothetical protein